VTVLPEVGFDESGNTGPDLLNEDQPVFVLASIGLDENQAAALLGQPRNGEHHSVNLRQSRLGQRRILDLIDRPELEPGTVKIAVMHKRFMVTGKFVDLIVEPLAAQAGIDLYRQGHHVALSNLLHMTWPAFDAVGAQALAERFIAWARTPCVKTATSLSAAIERMSGHSPDGFAELLRAGAAMLLEDPTAFAGAGDVNDLDPAGPSLVGLLQEWSALLGPFNIVHDDSVEVRRWVPHIVRLSDAAQPPMEVQMWNGQSVRYPLQVGLVGLHDSARSAQIQLADLLAGAAASGFGSFVTRPRPKQRVFARAVAGSRLLEWVIGSSVWPSRDVTPAALGARSDATPWVVDRLAAWG
jgi:hypothetical protein